MCTGSACRRGEGKRQAYRADGHAHGHAHGHAKATVATVATEAAEERQTPGAPGNRVLLWTGDFKEKNLLFKVTQNWGPIFFGGGLALG